MRGFIPKFYGKITFLSSQDGPTNGQALLKIVRNVGKDSIALPITMASNDMDGNIVIRGSRGAAAP